MITKESDLKRKLVFIGFILHAISFLLLLVGYILLSAGIAFGLFLYYSGLYASIVVGVLYLIAYIVIRLSHSYFKLFETLFVLTLPFLLYEIYGVFFLDYGLNIIICLLIYLAFFFIVLLYLFSKKDIDTPITSFDVKRLSTYILVTMIAFAIITPFIEKILIFMTVTMDMDAAIRYINVSLAIFDSLIFVFIGIFTLMFFGMVRMQKIVKEYNEKHKNENKSA